MADQLKHGATFSFLDGSLSINLSGYADKDGWGQFSFDERQIEQVPHEDDDRYSVVIDIPKSELIELRNFLNRHFPADIPVSPEIIAALEAAERAIDDCQSYRSHLHHKELAQVRAAIAKSKGGAS